MKMHTSSNTGQYTVIRSLPIVLGGGFKHTVLETGSAVHAVYKGTLEVSIH
jgi:hypothetical protein